MTDQQIFELASTFRSAIVKARDQGSFTKDLTFWHFPRGCCGDTCDLLAYYLRLKRINTLYVWGNYGDSTHAWLVVNDNRVKEPTPRFYETPPEIRDILKAYGGSVSESPIDVTRYEENDLLNGLIIDITGDQFGQQPVYVGPYNSFYFDIEFEEAHGCGRLNDYRQNELYQKIANHLPTRSY